MGSLHLIIYSKNTSLKSTALATLAQPSAKRYNTVSYTARHLDMDSLEAAFSKALKEKDVNDLLRSIGAIESIDPVATNDTSGPKGGESESQEDKVEEKQEEAEEESDENTVLDSFD
ncbi:hypothetical protein TWF679_006739 [Orbilia oligospora]|uniref:60S acidic ribosomal protein P2 n=1 Tax=Orbilia oligospora TaxID=2813651 RepID=A0A8H8V903_ORBOL|nr:hypothetical protein TWF679_006739 [Orbilia oligospora]